jgi:hypothetical protein
MHVCPMVVGYGMRRHISQPHRHTQGIAIQAHISTHSNTMDAQPIIHLLTLLASSDNAVRGAAEEALNGPTWLGATGSTSKEAVVTGPGPNAPMLLQGLAAVCANAAAVAPEVCCAML